MCRIHCGVTVAAKSIVTLEFVRLYEACTFFNMRVRLSSSDYRENYNELSTVAR